VRFVENSGRHLTLFERNGDTWRPVCTSPCLFPAPEGPRDYGAPIQSGPTAKYRVAAKSLWLAKGDGLQAEFQERKSIRKAGLCMILGGLAMLAFIPVAAEAPNKAAGLTGLLVPSGAITITGLVMLLLKDRVRLKRCVGCNAALPPPTAPSAPAS
jgi:hypothetical protein